MMRRVLFAIFAGIAIVGAFLVVRPYLRRPVTPDVPKREDASVLPPPWIKEALTRQQFTAKLQPLPENRLVAVELGRELIRQSITGIDHIRGEVRMIRALDTGPVYDSRLIGSLEKNDHVGRLQMTAYREDADSMQFRAEFRDGALSSAEWLVGTGGALTVDPDLPLAIGDLPVRDLVAAYNALCADSVSPAGVDSTGRIVLDMRFSPPEGDAKRRGEGRAQATIVGDVRAASALLWLSAADLSLDAARVFNSSGLLVRTLDGFRYGAGYELRSFRLRSFATSSKTTFHIDVLAIGAE